MHNLVHTDEKQNASVSWPTLLGRRTLRLWLSCNRPVISSKTLAGSFVSIRVAWGFRRQCCSEGLRCWWPQTSWSQDGTMLSPLNSVETNFPATRQCIKRLIKDNPQISSLEDYAGCNAHYIFGATPLRVRFVRYRLLSPRGILSET